ncbi:MAG: hypothetical protein K1W30_10515 [Lachnospiraceae bacterium]
MRKPKIPLPFYDCIRNLAKNFIKCGTIGWCMEITFTALGALRRRELPLVGQTSLWMFPIYGSAAFFKPVFSLFRHCHLIVRGTVYALSIFGAEYASGRILATHELCPWNYRRHHWHINGLIRIDYFPFWFLAGLLFERILTDHASPAGGCASPDINC